MTLISQSAVKESLTRENRETRTHETDEYVWQQVDNLAVRHELFCNRKASQAIMDRPCLSSWYTAEDHTGQWNNVVIAAHRGWQVDRQSSQQMHLSSTPNDAWALRVLVSSSLSAAKGSHTRPRGGKRIATAEIQPTKISCGCHFPCYCVEVEFDIFALLHPKNFNFITSAHTIQL